MTSTRRWWSASKTLHLAAATHWHMAHTQSMAGHPQQQQQVVGARQREHTAACLQHNQPVQLLPGCPKALQHQASSRRYGFRLSFFVSCS